MSIFQHLYDNSPTLSNLFPEWLTGAGSSVEPFETRNKTYCELVQFLDKKGVHQSEIPHTLFEQMHAYLQDGTPIYYDDPLRRFVVWVGAGAPGDQRRIFFRP